MEKEIIKKIKKVKNMLKTYMTIKRSTKIITNIITKPKRIQQIKNIKNRVFYGNFVERHFINYVSNKITDPKIILEIGSRDGYQSIEFSRIYPKAKIYTFECNPESIKTCIKNTKNYKNIEVVPYAVFNKNGRMSFNVVPELVGVSSLFNLTKKYSDENKFTQEKITVDVIRIDTWAKEKSIEKIDLIWIDIQGAEYEAFEGMGKLLSKVQAIYTEVEIKEIFIGQKLMKNVSRLLDENGFSLLKYTETSDDKWGNAIYIYKCKKMKTR